MAEEELSLFSRTAAAASGGWQSRSGGPATAVTMAEYPVAARRGGGRRPRRRISRACPSARRRHSAPSSRVDRRAAYQIRRRIDSKRAVQRPQAPARRRNGASGRGGRDRFFWTRCRSECVHRATRTAYIYYVGGGAIEVRAVPVTAAMARDTAMTWRAWSGRRRAGRGLHARGVSKF